MVCVVSRDTGDKYQDILSVIERVDDLSLALVSYQYKNFIGNLGKLAAHTKSLCRLQRLQFRFSLRIREDSRLYKHVCIRYTHHGESTPCLVLEE